MSIKFFGQFLLEQGKITSEQLLEAISYQETKNLKFGAYAQKKGYLSAADTEKLNEEQKTTDLRIGELAVKLGMLEASQVEEILTMQKNDHIQIGKAIVSKGFLSEAELDASLADFKKDQSPYAAETIGVPSGIHNSDLVSDIVDMTLKMLRRVVGLEAKCDSGAILKTPPAKAYSAVSITLSGGMNCDYIIMGDEDGSRSMASAILGADASGETAEMVADGVNEFANMVCGNIMARMAQKGKNVEISIPHILEYKSDYGITTGDNSVVYNISTTGGNIMLALVVY